ncbi:hypothetical protein O3M35_010458 [Rhynocoris fuscipes]|uniref:Uncharacterized protein n=1 Tax=Rhynocoris fuscipes TaxID=488301 RepID=A0AAW1D241_9HEMI
MAGHRSPPIHILVTKMVYLMILFIIIFIMYIDDYFIDVTVEVDNMKKKSPTKLPRKEEFCDVKHLLEPPAPKPPDGTMDLYDPPPFDMGYDDNLINNVNNVDVKYEANLNDLFTKVGKRYDFLLEPKGKPVYPPGYAMSPNIPPPFDMGYDDILINEVNNKTPQIDIYIQEILRKERKESEDPVPVGVVSYSEVQMDLNQPPPFNDVPGEVLINEVNNTDEIEEIDVNVIFTMPFLRKHYQFLQIFSGIIERIQLPLRKAFPPGYAMSPNDPPPFNVGTGDVLFNEVNNRDVIEDIDINELLGVQPKKVFRIFRTPKGKCNNKKELPSQIQ